MARPRKMTTEKMIEIVDSYYLACSDGNENLLKCSLIAEYAQELGFAVDGYDFRRNTEVREHIEWKKVYAETYREVCGEKYLIPSYKTLDVEGLLKNSGGKDQLAQALRDLDDYWNRIYEHSRQASKKNKILMKEKSGFKETLTEMGAEIERLSAVNSDLSVDNNKLLTENRYLRKMLRTYLYPAVADEILRSENELPQTDTGLNDAAACDFIENNVPMSFEAAVSKDDRLQSEAERLIERLWEKCDE